MKQIINANITKIEPLPKPSDLVEHRDVSQYYPFIASSRETIHKIIFGEDKRFLLIVGPCSIHDTQAGLEYAQKLKTLSDKVSDRIYVVMRAYFEKPRTSLGWKGLIMDPHLDGSFDIPTGIRVAREFLFQLISLGVPTATELLDPITPQYIADLICWSAIGARTTESQTHRQLASGLSMPLGFKNSTDGSIEHAINAIIAASQPQTFMGINNEGRASAFSTTGNPDCHIVLRGGRAGPNYDRESVKTASEALLQQQLKNVIMVDCSHANCFKNHNKQVEVFESILEQLLKNDDSPIIGAMLESNLHEGNQKFPQALQLLKYGVSITDSCIDWEITEHLITQAYQTLENRLIAQTAR